MRRLLVIFFLFFIFNDLITSEDVNLASSEVTKPEERKRRKKEKAEPTQVAVPVEPEPQVDVKEIMKDIIAKDDEIVNLNKSRANFKLATQILTGAVGTLLLLLAGTTGLAIYNHRNGRSPFSLKFKSEKIPEPSGE